MERITKNELLIFGIMVISIIVIEQVFAINLIRNYVNIVNENKHLKIEVKAQKELVKLKDFELCKQNTIAQK